MSTWCSSLKADAAAKGVPNLNLRMVYMCNCYGSTVNDDWLAAGAKASVGSHMNDMMPETPYSAGQATSAKPPIIKP